MIRARASRLRRALLLQAARGLPPAVATALGRLQFRVPGLRRLLASGTSTLRTSDVVIRHGVGAGMRFNSMGTNVGYALGTTEPELQQILPEILEPGYVVYDLGANVGFFTVLAARLVGDKGRVYAFEPLPANLEGLRHNLALNNLRHVEVIASAVSDVSGMTDLDVYDHGVMAKIATSDSVDFQGGRAIANTIPVSVVTLDEQVRDGMRPPDVIKIDIEGAEVAALRGARHTLAAHRPVLICSLHATNDAILALAEELGYELSCLDEDVEPAEASWHATLLARPATG